MAKKENNFNLLDELIDMFNGTDDFEDDFDDDDLDEEFETFDDEFDNYVYDDKTFLDNRKPLSNDEEDAEEFSFDERKTESADNVNGFIIDSSVANIEMFASNSNEIEVHFYGHAVGDGAINFKVKNIDGFLTISVKTKGTFYESNLQVDIALPHKKYKAISVKTISAKIELQNNILTRLLEAASVSGKIESNVTFKEAYISSTSGRVDLNLNADSDISAGIKTISSKVNIKLNNIGQLNLNSSSVSGYIKNNHTNMGDFSAKINVSTISGKITIE